MGKSGVKSQALPASGSTDFAAGAFNRLRRLDRAIKDARTGDVSAIHQLRVTSRRLQEILRIVSTGKKRIRFEDEYESLRNLRRSFRRVRDLDVLMGALIPPPESGQAINSQASLLAAMMPLREAAFRKAVRSANALHPQSLITSLRKDLDRLAKAGEFDLQRIRKAVDQLIKLRSRAVLDLTRNPTWTDDIHGLRIAVKRLRYALELQGSASIEGDDALLGLLASVQETLGNWNDHGVAARIVARLVSGKRSRAVPMALRGAWLRYAAERAELAENTRASIMKEWPPLREQLARRFL
jgi:CHAD domain-containing protein